VTIHAEPNVNVLVSGFPAASGPPASLRRCLECLRDVARRHGQKSNHESNQLIIRVIC
jgi:hypothetical protein